MRRMFAEQENVFYYVTVMNEKYAHPELPKGSEEGILRGMHKIQQIDGDGPRVQLLGCGTILREVIAAAEMLAQDFGVGADIWSITSFNELRRDGIDVERWSRQHPKEKARTSYVEQCLSAEGGPVIAATDYMRNYAEQIRPYVPTRYEVLGTDGYGRSDLREKLRSFFEVDRRYVSVAALKALADEGELKPKQVADAIAKYGIDPEKPNPVGV